MIEIRLIDAANKKDINIPNEPFRLIGRMIPSYVNEEWSYRITYFDEGEIGEMCFPDENYDYDVMKKDYVFVGAYDGTECVGLAILKNAWYKYMYLYDLKICAKYRHLGVGVALIEKAKEVCRERGYRGLSTQGQDNNVAACRFYLKVGFHIGGLNTNIYKGTTQEGKSDILFYMDC